MAAVEERDAKQKHAASSSADFEPFSSVRRQIAEAVTLSRKTIPSFVIDRWVETAAIDQARRALTRRIEHSTGGKPTLTDFLLFALAAIFVRRIPASSTVGMKTMAASAGCVRRASTSASSSPFPMGS